MRSLGSLYTSPRKSKISRSDKNVSVILSSFFLPFSFLYNPCSLSEYPNVSAYPRITVLKSLLPVKYNIENGYSSYVEYKKSTRRATLCLSNLQITNDFVGPRDNISIIMLFSNNLSTNFTNTSLFFDVIIRSISPDV